MIIESWYVFYIILKNIVILPADLGHKNVQTTYDLYIHTSSETFGDADVLDEAISST